MMISKGSLTGRWQVEQSGVEFTEMMSGVKVDDKSIVTSVTAGKESGVSIVILKSTIITDTKCSCMELLAE